MHLADLSSELVLLIFEHLTLPDIATMRVLNSGWDYFVGAHESAIYRNCAILHGYVRVGLPLDDAKNITYGSRWLINVNSWKTFCNEYYSLDRRWDYRARPRAVSHAVPENNPAHRIKIDEEDGLILSTNCLGGLDVRSTFSFEDLWNNPRIFVRRWAHVEYSNGFAVFDRYDNSHEVWVKASKAGQFQEFGHPHLSQIRASEQATMNAEDPRGRFVPHLVLENPVLTRAYRLVFPELLVASEAETTAHIWNIVEGRIVEAYSLAQGLGPTPDLDEGENGDDATHSSISYVELSPSHIFVCFSTKLVVYRRASNPFSEFERNKFTSGPPWKEAAPVLVLPHAFYSTEPGRRSVSPLQVGVYAGKASPITPIQLPLSTVRMFQPTAPFSAVHVSPDGADLVAVTLAGTLFFAKDFADRSPGGRKIWTVDVKMSIRNLAFDGARVAFSTDAGVHVFRLAPTPEAQDRIFPAKAIYTVERFEPPGHIVSCLQLTRTSLWYVVRSNEFEIEFRGASDYGSAFPRQRVQSISLGSGKRRAIVHIDYANDAKY